MEKKYSYQNTWKKVQGVEYETKESQNNRLLLLQQALEIRKCEQTGHHCEKDHHSVQTSEMGDHNGATLLSAI